MADELELQVAARLRAVMQAFDIATNPEMAVLCGATTSAVNNWRLGYNLPRVPEMIRLAEQTGLTLDWLYRGLVCSMDPLVAIRLNKIVAAQSAAD